MTYETPWFDNGLPEVVKVPLYFICPLCPFSCKDPADLWQHAEEHILRQSQDARDRRLQEWRRKG